MMFRTVLTLAVLVSTAAIARAEQSTDQAPAVNFTDHVLPIFRQHCLKCHNANDAEAGLAIDSYGGLMEGGGSGDVVAAGDPSGSRLYLVMTHAEEPAMPPNQEPLPAESLEVIRKWIEGGLLENSGSKAKKRKGPSLSFSSAEGGKPDEIIMPESVWRVPVITTERTAAATALAASPWAPLVAVAGQRQVSLYNTDNSELVGILPYPEGIPQVLNFSRDGAYLLVAGGTHSSQGTASLYDVRSGQRMLKVGDELDIVFGADINDQLSRIALGGPQRIVRIFDTASGEPVFELKKHTDWVYCVDYSPDGVLVASGDRSGGLHVWEADTGRLYLDLIGHKAAVRALAWRPDSNVLVSASEDGTVIMWEMNAGNQLKSFNAHGGGVTGVAMAKDGRIVTSGKDKTVKLWNNDGAAVATMPAFNEPALEVAITHDGSKIIGGDWNGRTVMWQIADPNQASELVANPPPLEDQQAALAESVATLEKTLASAATELANRRSGVEADETTVASLASKLEQTKTAVAKLDAERLAAENLLADMQKQKPQQDQRLQAAQNRVAELDQKLKQSGEQLEATQKQLADAQARRDQAAKAKESVEQSIAAVEAEHAKLKADALAAMSALADRELEALAQERAAADAETRAQAAHGQAVKSLADLNAQLASLEETIKLAMQGSQVTAAEFKAAGEAIEASTAQVETNRKQVDARSAELASLQKQLSETADETEKKAVAEKVAAAQAELDNARKTFAAAEKQLVDAIANRDALQLRRKEGEDKIASAKESTGKVSAQRDQLMQSLPSLASERDRLVAIRSGHSQALQQIRADIQSANGQKEEAVKKMAALLEQQAQLKVQSQQLARVFAKEEELRSTAEAKAAESQQTIASVKQLAASARAELEATAKQHEEFSKGLAAQPGVIATLAASLKMQTDEIPKLEQQLAAANKKVEESRAGLAGAESAVATATTQLDAAKARLAGIQSELVAFQSQAEKLQNEAAAARSLASEKRTAVEPQAEMAAKLAESMEARDQQLAQVSETLKKLQAELEALQQSQASDQAKLEETKSRLEELETEAEEAEAAAEETDEKLEFFQSAYGA